MILRIHFDAISQLRVKVASVNILSLKFIFGHNYIDTWREAGLKSKGINHTNWCDCIKNVGYEVFRS